jgi:hypothetical protein
MTAVYICSLFTGSGYHIVSIPLTDGSCVYVLFIGSGSHIVIIPLTDGSCVYMLSFYRKYFSYCYHSPY